MPHAALAQAAITLDPERLHQLLRRYDNVDVDAALAMVLHSAPSNRRAVELLVGAVSQSAPVAHDASAFNK